MRRNHEGGVETGSGQGAEKAAQDGDEDHAAGPGAASLERLCRGARAPASAHDANGGRVTVRVYRQELGDCILVRVKRSGHEDFKLMIDCEVVLGTPDAVKTMTRVMENLVSDTQDKVDVLAITHEHWDHLSGFTQAPDSFAKLAVGAVWVAWTEDPKDDLANQLRAELGAAKDKLKACASALRAVDDGATAEALEDIALIPLGAAASSSGSTRAAFDKVKARGNVRLCRPTDAPFEIPDADARIYALGPPHDPKLIRKINPSTSNPETYGLAMNGGGALPLGVVAALNKLQALDGQNEDPEDKAAPFHPRVTIPLDARGRPAIVNKPADDGDDWRAIDRFFQDNYVAGALAADRRRMARLRDGSGARAAKLHQQHEPRARARARRPRQGRRAPVRRRRAGRQLGSPGRPGLATPAA